VENNDLSLLFVRSGVSIITDFDRESIYSPPVSDVWIEVKEQGVSIKRVKM